MKHAAAAAILCLACVGASAQALQPAWEGEWTAFSASQGAASAQMRIARDGAGTRVWMDGKSCALAYGDTVQQQAVQQRVAALRAFQLDPAHWPAGTDTRQLAGLAREFDRAQAMLAAVAPGAYRSVRIQGADCATPDDVYFLLHKGQELLRISFPEAALGVAVTAWRRQR